jgi:hypothetical protein
MDGGWRRRKNGKGAKAKGKELKNEVCAGPGPEGVRFDRGEGK